MFWKTTARALGTGMMMAGFALPAKSDALGRAEYLMSCASCHGAGATGDGPMAKFLNVDVPDLTALGARNDGQFPMSEVLRIIDGRPCGPAIENRPCLRPTQELRAHDRAMPVRGNRYKDAAVFDAGQDDMAESPELVVLGRILALAYYLESIQQ